MSVDGYFGEGTPCFFIRGTILSDIQVDGEYRTLAISRPGNLIEIESFDGEWATVVISTRAGNRVGDNLRARLMLRDADLRAVGVDCERILAGLGSFEQPDEPEKPQPAPEAPVAAAIAEDVPPAFAPWNGASNGVAHVAEPVPESEPVPPEPARTSSFFGGRASVVDGKLFIELGASIVAVALPVVLFFLRSLLAKKDDR